MSWFVPLALLAGAQVLAALPPAEPGVARAYLVRHAQAYSNLTPTPPLSDEDLNRLTDRGQLQARAAAGALEGQGVVLILSSPAGRAQATAAILAEALGVPVRVERALRPLEIGRELDWDARQAEWDAGRDPTPPGGESLADLGARVEALVAGLPERHLGQAVVLVAHSEVIGAFLGALQGVPAPERLQDKIANASISVVDAARPSGLRLRLSNAIPWESDPD